MYVYMYIQKSISYYPLSLYMYISTFANTHIFVLVVSQQNALLATEKGKLDSLKSIKATVDVR